MQEHNNGRNKNRGTSANREDRGNCKCQYTSCCFWKTRTRLDNTEQVSSDSRAKRPGERTSDQFIHGGPERSSRRSLGNSKDTGWKTNAVLSKNDTAIVRSYYAARNGCKRSSSFTHAHFSAKGRTLKQGFVLENNIGQIHAFRWNIMGRFEKGDAKIHKSGSNSEVREVDYQGKRIVFKRVRASYRLAKREYVAWQLLSRNRYTKTVTCLLLDAFNYKDNYYFISYAYDTDFFYYLRKPHYRHEIFNYLLQIANALIVLHSFDLAHLDIKPENILLRGPYAVLSDFATVYKVAGTQNIKKQHGTYEYCAPEILEYKISKKSDVFSLTKTAFVALQGRFPNIDALDGYGTELSDLYVSGMEKDLEYRCNSIELYKKIYKCSLNY